MARAQTMICKSLFAVSLARKALPAYPEISHDHATKIHPVEHVGARIAHCRHQYIAQASASQGEPAAHGYTAEGDRDYWNDWPEYLTAQMNEARARRIEQLHAMRTEADVRARVDKVRSTVWKLVGASLRRLL